MAFSFLFDSGLLHTVILVLIVLMQVCPYSFCFSLVLARRPKDRVCVSHLWQSVPARHHIELTPQGSHRRDSLSHLWQNFESQSWCTSPCSSCSSCHARVIKPKYLRLVNSCKKFELIKILYKLFWFALIIFLLFCWVLHVFLVFYLFFCLFCDVLPFYQRPRLQFFKHTLGQLTVDFLFCIKKNNLMIFLPLVCVFLVLILLSSRFLVKSVWSKCGGGQGRTSQSSVRTLQMMPFSIVQLVELQKIILKLVVQWKVDTTAHLFPKVKGYFQYRYR